jgi:predicted Holliday junction resolvase-like endonuclease
MKLKFLKNKLSILALILLINHSNLLAQNNNVEKTNNSAEIKQNNNVEKTNNSAEIKQNNLVNQNNKSINNDIKNNKIIDKKVKKTPKKTLNK